MRSRLEARFAALLDQNGYGWLYEPRALADESGQYLPDFLITHSQGRERHGPSLYIEVRPTLERALLTIRQCGPVFSSEPDAQVWAHWPAEDGWGVIRIARGWIKTLGENEGLPGVFFRSNR
jgi:hypothetical protein